MLRKDSLPVKTSFENRCKKNRKDKQEELIGTGILEKRVVEHLYPPLTSCLFQPL